MAKIKDIKLPKIDKVTSAEQARDLAIEYSNWVGDQSLSYGELIYYTNYFEALAEKYPTLVDEFKENIII
jgi:hypothetical protein